MKRQKQKEKQFISESKEQIQVAKLHIFFLTTIDTTGHNRMKLKKLNNLLSLTS